MPDATAHRGLPFPEPTDVPDVPDWLGQLAVALDFDMHLITTMPRPAAGTLARAHRDPGTGIWSLDTGAGWVTLPTGGPFLPLAGGALSGAVDLAAHELSGAIVTEDRAKVTTVGASGAARTLDAAVSPAHDVTLDQNCTFTFTGVDGDRLTLVLRQPGALKTVTWPATVDWDTGIAPVQVASTAVVYRFDRIGGRWLGTPGAGRLFARKTASESVTNSTVMQADDHLVLPLAANRTYRATMQLTVDGNGGSDLKFLFGLPAGATFKGDGLLYDVSTNFVYAYLDQTLTAVTGLFGVGSSRPVRVQGLIKTAGTAGNVTLNWAQNVASVFPSTIQIDSWLELIPNP